MRASTPQASAAASEARHAPLDDVAGVDGAGDVADDAMPERAKCSTAISETGSSARRTLRPLPGDAAPGEHARRAARDHAPGSELRSLALVTIRPSMRACATSRS